MDSLECKKIIIFICGNIVIGSRRDVDLYELLLKKGLNEKLYRYFKTKIQEIIYMIN